MDVGQSDRGWMTVVEAGEVYRAPVVVHRPIQKPPLVVDAAAKKWDELIAAAPPGFFVPTDADALGAYCVAWVFYTKAVMALATEGLTTTNRQGRPVPHPMVAVKRQQEQSLQALGDRLGLSPSARAATPRSGPSWWG